MKNYAISARITLIITIISFVGVMIVHYEFGNCDQEANFWVNVLLAIFGSGLLTAISSFIGYFHEKTQLMEGFYYNTRKFINFLNTYNTSWVTKEKIRFFIDYSNIDKTEWDKQLGGIYFLYDPMRKNFKRIHLKIYCPIIGINELINSYTRDLKEVKNDEAANNLINVIESKLSQIRASDFENIPNESNMSNEVEIKFKILTEILEELYGNYYNLMYNVKQTEGKK